MVLRAANCPSEREISPSERHRRSSEHHRCPSLGHSSRPDREISLSGGQISRSEGHECPSRHQISPSEGQFAARSGNFARKNRARRCAVRGRPLQSWSRRRGSRRAVALGRVGVTTAWRARGRRLTTRCSLRQRRIRRQKADTLYFLDGLDGAVAGTQPNSSPMLSQTSRRTCGSSVVISISDSRRSEVKVVRTPSSK